MQIGPIQLPNNLVLAPMAGITDRPFRQLCKRMGAGLAVCEMVGSRRILRSSNKTKRRVDHEGEAGPISVQIVGADALALAEAARYNVDQGAQIIDINMGCPARKVCRAGAGAALMRDEALVARVLEAVVASVEVPVTLKMRTGWSPTERNGVQVARIAESAGIQALAVHGRTRACDYHGTAEYATTKAIKQAVAIPVVANGDIDSPEKARQVFDYTGADGVMLGRGTQGRPWLFREVAHYLATGSHLPPLAGHQVRDVLLEHLDSLYRFYGRNLGLRIARKHIAWYCRTYPGSNQLVTRINRTNDIRKQLRLVTALFSNLPPEERLVA